MPSYAKDAPHERLRRLIDERWDGSDRTFAEAVGFSPQSLSRLVNGHSSLRESPNATRIAHLLGVSEAELLYGEERERAIKDGQPPRRRVPEPDPHGSPAEQLLHHLGLRAGLRRVAGELTTKDLITAAYSIARDDGWTVEEFRKLDAWRDAILEKEQKRED